MDCTKPIIITVLRVRDFVRLFIVISFQLIFYNSMHEGHTYNPVCVKVRSDPSKLIAMQPLKKSLFNCKMNVR